MQIKYGAKVKKLSIVKLVIGFVLFLIFSSELMYYLGYRDDFLLSQNMLVILCGILFAGSLMGLLMYSKQTDKIILSFFLFTLCTVFSTLYGAFNGTINVKWCLCVTLFFSVFIDCYLAQKREGTFREGINIFKVFYLCILLFYCVSLILNRNSVGRNSVYYILCLLPFTTFFGNRMVRSILYLSQFTIVLFSEKRTAFIAIVLFWITMEFLQNSELSNSGKVKKMCTYLILLVVIFNFASYLISTFELGIFDKMKNSIEDSGSGRVIIYKMVWEKQLGEGLVHWLFGEGYNAVMSTSVVSIFGDSLSSHNDFIEILYDYGIFGLVSYIVFLILLVKKSLLMRRNNYKHANAFIASIVLVLVISMTSHLIIYLNYYALIMAFWGMCLADYEKSLTDSRKVCI